MNKLILHVGPGKCGSSTIQQFFTSHKNPCVENLYFTILDQKEIKNINHANPSENAISYFSDLINTPTSSNAIIILSHEFLFQCSWAIKNICSISKGMVSEVLIVGYSRKQSCFITSAYSQWFFRSEERIKEVNNVLSDIGVDPIHFNGIERQLIASIANDYFSARQLSNYSILDWNKTYNEIADRTASCGVKIKCGVLPDKNNHYNLIEDFCKQSGLTIANEFKNLTDLKSNIKNNSAIIEATNIATELGFDTPGPHQNNDFFIMISQIIRSSNILDTKFLLALQQYTDSYFLDSNIEFCTKYGLDNSYFEASNEYSKSDILDLIKKEQLKRIDNNTTINKQKELIGLMAEACFQYYQSQKKESHPNNIAENHTIHGIKSNLKDFTTNLKLNWLNRKWKQIT